MSIGIRKITVKTIAYLILAFSIIYFINTGIYSQAAEPAKKSEAVAPATNASEPAKDAKAPVTEEKVVNNSPKAKSPGLIDLFVIGGWTMWPLLFSSIIGFGIAMERMYFFLTSKLVSKGYNQELIDAVDAKGLNGAKEYIESKKEYKISEVLINGLDVSSGDPDLFAKGVEREAAEVVTLLEKGLTILAAVSTIAPLIGFLGTVSGMIGAFDAIANADQVNAKVVAGGIKEALITTAAGLIVAIPVMSFYQYLMGRVNGFAANVEEGANRIYKELLRSKGKSLS